MQSSGSLTDDEYRVVPKQNDYIKKIISSAKHLLGIINDILDYSKIEANEMELENRSFDLNEILHNMSNRFFSQSGGKGA